MKTRLSNIYLEIARLERVKAYLYIRSQRVHSREALHRYIKQTKALSTRAYIILNRGRHEK